MFNLNELFIPTDYDLSLWTDITNLLYKNKAFFQFQKAEFETAFYNQYFDFVEKSESVKEILNSNYSIMIDRIILYLTSFDSNILDVSLDGDIKDWSIKVDGNSMTIEFKGSYEDKFASYKEKVYIINLKELSELSQYKELKNCIELFKEKYNQIIFMNYKKFVDTVERRLQAEEEDKDGALIIINSFKDDYKNNKGDYANDEWDNIICVIDSYKESMSEIIESGLYVIPLDVTNKIDYSILNDRLKEICLNEQIKF